MAKQLAIDSTRSLRCKAPEFFMPGESQMGWGFEADKFLEYPPQALMVEWYRRDFGTR
jgi:hypothetical protein